VAEKPTIYLTILLTTRSTSQGGFSIHAAVPCRDCRWFDAGTRAILFQMTFYNTNTKELTNLRLLVEVFESSFILPSYRFDTAKIVVYQSRTDQVRVRVQAGNTAVVDYFPVNL
jgi:hypothetical protein